MGTVVVDWRNLCKISSYSILSGSIACQFPTEPEEISHRIARRIYCLRADYPNDTLILAADKGPYWRNKYLDRWHSDRGLEPVGYKANRAGMSWPFATPREDMDMLFDRLFVQLSIATNAIRIKDLGLEADDIWGVIVKWHSQYLSTEKFIGISTDSDWRQLCGPNVSVVDPSTGITHTEPADIRAKCIAGDRGDNILGCNKRKKDGTPGTSMWGIDGAKKLLATDVDWEKKIDMSVFERNYELIALPCPSWDINECFHEISGSCSENAMASATEEETNPIWDRYGVTANVRKLLNDRAAREEWISKLRAHLATTNEVAKVKKAEEVGEVATNDTLMPETKLETSAIEPAITVTNSEACAHCGRIVDAKDPTSYFSCVNHKYFCSVHCLNVAK